ncbi:MAG: SOS response-associated peptidase [Myxococcales bacterium]|nr:SOS response-associated peptidase [Myxococcales bacterium]
MCGRFTLHTEKELLERRFQVDLGEQEVSPRYNIAPTEQVLVARWLGDARTAERMRWGLVPHWSRDPREGPGLINARIESVARTPAYRDSFRRRRCLILADGFYEWRAASGPGRPKIPHWFSLANQEPFAMAGIWASWRKSDDLFTDTLPVLLSCSILTAAANPAVAPIHRRMPVILHPEAEAAWLDPSLDDNSERLLELLVPVPAEALRVRPVSRRVNSVRNQGPDLLEPFDEDDPDYF